MLSRRLSTILLSSLLSLPAMATPFDNADFTIELPEGFTGPQIKNDPNGYGLVFSKGHAGDNTRTVLEIAVAALKDKPATLSETDLQKLANHMLAGRMALVATRRQSFIAAPPATLRLSKLPAARGSWSGKVQGVDATGSIYAVVAGKRVFMLQAQDQKRPQQQDLEAAMRAIEAIQIKERE
ncbi:hypothetical protein [Chitinimonas sp.]|uniref:hypothetical protein n=1 Tax=Chitinimonas sp. TaxID=1934313 RepID=UPI002F92B9D9